MLLSHVLPGVAWAGGEMKSDLGVETIVTRDETKGSGCEDPRSVEHHLIADLRPIYRLRGTSLETRATGLAKYSGANDPDPDDPKAQDASLDSVYSWQSGRHSGDIGLNGGYQDADRFRCAATVEERVKRERDLQDRIAIPGEIVRTRGGRLGYSLGQGGAKYSLDLSSSRRQGDFIVINHDILASYERKVDGTLTGSGGVGVGIEEREGKQDRIARAVSALSYVPVDLWQINLRNDWEWREDGERRVGMAGVLMHKLSSHVVSQLELTSRRSFHSEQISSLDGSLGIAYTDRRTTTALTGGRIELDDARRSASNYYRYVWLEQISKHQVLSLNLTYGSNQPGVVKGTDGATIRHDLYLSRHNTPLGQGGRRSSISTSYSVVRVEDLTEEVTVVRRFTLGLFATL